MRKFSEVFGTVKTNLHVAVHRSGNPMVTYYTLSRQTPVPNEYMVYVLSNGKSVMERQLEVDDWSDPDLQSIYLMRRLQNVNGSVIDSPRGPIAAKSDSIQMIKHIDVPDDKFDRDVITALAEYFGVELDNVTVEIQNWRAGALRP